MLDRRLRHTKEEILQPLADRLGAHLDPTTVTLIGGGVGILAAIAGWQAVYGLGLALWVLNRVLDGLDGTIARMFDKQTDFGAYIDILVDYGIYATVPVALAFSQRSQAVWMALIFMLAVFYVNSASWMFLSSILEKRNRGANAHDEMTTVTMPAGIVEGTETVIFYGLFFLLPGLLQWLFLVFGLLTLVTVVQRLLWTKKHLGNQN